MKSASGKFVLRISPDVHARLRRHARTLGCSLNEFCRQMIEGGADSPSRKQSPFPLISDRYYENLVSYWGKQLLSIIIFGSAAKGDMKDSSDIDLLLVLKAGLPLSRNLYREWDVFHQRYKKELPHTHEISPQFVILQSDPLSVGGIWYEAAVDGRTLWEHGTKVSSFLADLRSAMASGKIQRKFSHGLPYWIKLAS